ncbi:hypothetical protein AGMMS49592_4060 [Endomicrobiia bacterium]|nr:hypothetical protein AGMMS49592_4060 [Endomicrobiia bacterium]
MQPDNDNKFVFIKGDYPDFSRMMSNLADNAIDAAGQNKRIVVS